MIELWGITYEQILFSNRHWCIQWTTHLRSFGKWKAGRTVYAGPTEATAIGNLSAQMIAEGELQDLSDARNRIYESFAIKIY